MAKDPSHRPQSATALLEEVADELGVGAALATAVPETARPASRRPRRRSSVRSAVVAALAAALLGGALGLTVDPLGDDARSAPAGAGAVAALDRLEAERSDLRARLAAAETPGEQAGIAGELAAAYGEAAAALASGPQARSAASARDAYARLATAADAGDEAEFAAASDAVTRAEQQLQTRR
jgi:hypothetical protein